MRQLPQHLRKYIVDQDYPRYTFEDHALWRYVMRQNYSYLKDAAYYPYIPGLKKAGLTIEKIPSLQEINDSLAEIGWGAVTVDGFIPPAAFMEYQARRVLVIAADIRTLEHIEYTPAPDIIHESAGHAPIISDVHYNSFLSHLGTVGTKAMFSRQDHELYEAIRELSILKETPGADSKAIKNAEEKLKFRQENMGEPSEMALLSRLQWWTVEYGLIGSLHTPKIYGAGLLSSIGESVSCMRPEVKKIPYTIDAINYGYDITKPQPQLFVTPNFENLLSVLYEFENSMTAKIGGYEGILKAIASQQICTVVLDSGIQISGKFINVLQDNLHEPIWFKTEGPSSLAKHEKVLPHGHPDQCIDGVTVLLGNLAGSRKSTGELTRNDLNELSIRAQQNCTLLFTSGISVSGKVSMLRFYNNKLYCIEFETANVITNQGQILHQSPDGPFKLTMGNKVVSVFSGSADKSMFDDGLYLSGRSTVQASITEKEKRYHKLFGEIRDIRENQRDTKDLNSIWEEIQKSFPNDWLASMEIAEMTENSVHQSTLYHKVRKYLEKKMSEEPKYKKLISDGLTIIDQKLVFK